MNRYVVVSEYRRRGERIDIPSRAEGITIEPTDQAEVVEITYLDPVYRVSIDEPRSEQIDVDKQ